MNGARHVWALVALLSGLAAAGCAPQVPLPVSTPTSANTPASAQSAAATAGSGSQNLKRVRISYASPSLGDLHIYVAQHEGFFRQQGIDAELVLLNTQGAVAALNNGDTQFIDSPTTIAEGANNGLPFKVLMVAWKAPPWLVIGKSDIGSIEQLRGKSVGVGSAGSSPYQHLQAALKQVGMGLSDISAVQTTGTEASYSALVAGQLDAVVITPPFDALAARQGFHEIKFLGGMLKVPYLGLGTSTQMLQSDPDDVAKVLRALVDACNWMRGHPDETTAILAEQLKITPDLARPTIDRMLPLISDDFEPPLDGMREALQNQAELVGKPANVKAEDVVDTGPLHGVLAQQGH